MRIHIYPYLLIFLFILDNNAPAQTSQVKFNLVSGSNGILLGKINAITRDRQGVMWFSDQDHQCIVRYDGTLMTSYPFDPKNPNSLGGRYPECILADSGGRIWIGFIGSGLDRFDPETNTFTHFRHRANDSGSLASENVSVMLIDHLGNFWVGTDGGLDLFNQVTGKFRHFAHNELDSTTLSHNVVRCIYEDHEGTVWVGTGIPWAEPVEKGGLNRFIRETGKFTRYLNDPQNPRSLINNKVRAIFEDSRGVFWVGTAGDGLHTMDRKTGVFERHTYNPAKPDQLSRSPLGNNKFDHITFITEDALGYLWIGTFANGINRYDPLTKKITHFGGNGGKSGVFKDNSSWCVNVSKDSLFWLSTQEPNLYRIDLFLSAIDRHEINTGVVHCFYEETPSVLWIGTDSGLFRKNLRNGTSHRFLNKPLDPNSLSNSVVGTIVRDEGGDFWLGTFGGGIDRLNPKTGIFTRFQHNAKDSESLCNDHISVLYEDSRSNLWVGTADGLDLMNRNTGKFTHYQNKPNDSSSFSQSTVTSILEGEPNVLWIGTYYDGVDKMNIQTGKFTHYLPGAFVSKIHKDATGIIWMGTANGLYWYNKQLGDFSFFDSGNSGFRIPSVSSIIGDNQNNLWVASSPGIYRINPTRDQIIIYDKKNGVEGFASQVDWGVSSYKGLDGEVFFSAPSGYYSFYPSRLRVAPSTLTIQLTNFWLKGVAVDVAPGGPLTEPLAKAKEIHLRHDQNEFSFGLTAIDYGSPGDKIFYCKLENYDLDWRLMGAEEKVYYFNVPPGKYVFRARVLNSTNGASSEKDIALIISSPWWNSWWVYGLSFLFLATTIYMFNRMQRKQLIRKERERGKLRELEMQTLRAQMNPHFIFNCLSSINHFVLKNETEAASDYLTKFSRLIRNVLTNSKKTYISLEEELETVRLYLEMEKLRFKNSFVYYIHVDPIVDPSAVYLPPLLFQPFVENAVWHGLMHKTDPGRLDLRLTTEKKVLICIIEDNGVGRAFARASESKSVEKQKSMGIQITRQRMSLINGDAGIVETDFKIEDLYDEKGHARGTKVLLRIMYKEVLDEFV